MPYIYMITNKVNSKKYIGKTMKSIEKRFQEHLSGSNKERNKDRPLYKAIKKYGIDNFTVELLEEVKTDQEASEREMFWINYYRTYVKFKDCNGYNATLGGDGKQYINYNEVVDVFKECHSEKDTAAKLRISSDTVRAALRQYNIDAPNNQQAKFAEANKVQMFSLDGELLQTFDSLNQAVQWICEQTGQKYGTGMTSHISDVCKGTRKTAYGYKWKCIKEGKKTEAYNDKSKKEKYKHRKVKCIETGRVYEGVTDAAMSVFGKKTYRDGISLCCQGKQHTCGGFHWEYVDKNENKNDIL